MTRLIIIFMIMTFFAGHVSNTACAQQDLKRYEYLQQLIKVLPGDEYTSPDDYRYSNPRVSPEDFTWSDWQQRTGELPPDFDELPNRPFLPDPLIIDEGGKNIPVETLEQWSIKRKEIKKLAQYWITGTAPPPPENIISEVIEEKFKGKIKELTVLLKFGPGHRARLHINLLIPPGEGPFPVFMCPWKKNRYDWVQAAVRRGYIGCRFTATDPKYGYPDDSEAYEEIWWPEYDFKTLMRWGWAASRAIDFLYTLDYINKNQIGLTGLSRNGKMSLWAAAYDERIKAVIPISGGTGSENPFTYTNEKYDNESIAEITRGFPYWLQPRLRFFIGRENKLPVDQNLLMALVAPRGLMLTSSIFENQGNPWGIEQAYMSAKKAYNFLGAEDKIAIDLRHGLHAPSARDMEKYIDFFDYIFGRGDIKPENKLYYNYSFSRWLGLSGEMINPEVFRARGIDDLLRSPGRGTIKEPSLWEKKKNEIRKRINWGLGEEPLSLAPGSQPDYMRSIITRPRVSEATISQAIGFGTLYYLRSDIDKHGDSSKIPVVIWLHEYAYSTGYRRRSQPLINDLLEKGFAVYAMDQIGFGTRIEEGSLFYERFPHWSKMGRMVADVRYAVDALSEIEFIDKEHIYTVGYTLGATVGLYSAAMDDRIAGTVSVCGFTPMRTDIQEKTAEGIFAYSHIHGLLPRLGFFIGEESRIPYDFDELLACIAPRQVLLIAPSWDQYADIDDIRECVEKVRSVYGLYNAEDKIDLYVPDDYNRFSPEMQHQVVQWLEKQKGVNL